MDLTTNSLRTALAKWFQCSIYQLKDFTFIDDDLMNHVAKDFESDFSRYFPGSTLNLKLVESRLEVVGILLYRISRYLFLYRKNEELATIFGNLMRQVTGIEIYYSADIGPGLKINHGIGLVVGARVKIGKQCLLHQGVTLGDRHGNRPVLKDFVTVFAGAKVLGGITLENNSVVAANAVCISDVPANAVVVGIPGKVLQKAYEY